MDFRLGRGYCDLNIPWRDREQTLPLLKRCFMLGYETLAVSVKVHQKDLSFKSKRKGKLGKETECQFLTEFPPPPLVSPEDVGAKGGVILTRLTLIFNDNDFLPMFNNSLAVKAYDLIALCPTSAQSLQNLLKSGFRGDIIAIDTDPDAGAVKWTRKLYTECLDKNMFFELPYSPAIRDKTMRRRIIRQSHIYNSVGRSKKIIISSEAFEVLELRGPHDVSNLACLFGLNEQQGKDAVKLLPCNAVKSGAGRRLGPFRCLAQHVNSLTDDERKAKIPEESSSSEEDV